MAILKEIELDNGVVIRYHRIVRITKITNHCTILEVAGYTSKDKREEEVKKMAAQEEYSVYIDTSYINIDYDEESTIKDWYDYLKTTEKYNGAEDDEDSATKEESK